MLVNPNINKNMKTFGKIIICIIVVIIAIGIAFLINKQNDNNKTNANISNTTQNNTKNETNTTFNQTASDDNYIGLEEKVEPLEKEEEEKPEEDASQTENEETKTELTGEEKAIDIVKNKYATNGQTVKFDHMEGENYVIKLNDGTAVTWYLVDGTTWEAEEY